MGLKLLGNCASLILMHTGISIYSSIGSLFQLVHKIDIFCDDVSPSMLRGLHFTFM